MSDRGQKTEQATARRIERARREGQFPTARQVVGAARYLACTAILARWGDVWLQQARQTARFLIGRAFAPDLRTPDFIRMTGDLLFRLFMPLVIAGVALLAVTFTAQMVV